jgi:large subunit ribosomal protein L25
MDAVSISVEERAAFGKGAARKLRASGRIPVVIYRSGDPAQHLSVSPRELEGIFRRTNNRNTLLAVEAGGATRTCLVKDVQRNPLSQEIIHLDLYEVDATENVRVEVNFVATGTAVGVKLGGRLRTMRRTVDVICKPGDIPSEIGVDVSTLEVGRFRKLSEVEAPGNTTFPYANDFNLFTVVGKRGAAEEEEEESAVEEA